MKPRMSIPSNKAKGRPFIWDIRDYGDHPLAAPIKNLDALLVAPIVVRTLSAKNCTVTPLLPLTMGGLKTWGNLDLDTVDKGDRRNFIRTKATLNHRSSRARFPKNPALAGLS